MIIFKSINKFIPILLISAFFFAFLASNSFAQKISLVTNSSVGNNATKNTGERDEIMNTFREEVKEKNDSWLQKKLEVRTQVMTRVRANIGVVGKRYLTALDRYEELVARIEARVAIEKAKGIDTSSIEASLATVKAEIAALRPVLEGIVSKLDVLNENSSQEEIVAGIKEVRDSLKEQKESLKAIHEELKTIVSDLRILVLPITY